MSTPLTSKQRAYLRALAHGLEPVVQIGHHGTTAAVIAQVEEALVAHELVKLRLGRECPDSPEEAGSAIGRSSGARLVQVIGRTVVVYRARNERPGIELTGAPAPRGAPRHLPEGKATKRAGPNRPARTIPPKGSGSAGRRTATKKKPASRSRRAQPGIRRRPR
ncbi:MAG: ribosome assembly RNA-binding protein YhbY [Polyangiaceae bacterium]|nr:ribosome assembly RNA-binding protein YhbY [Polyangiaceae bacterium]